MKQRAKVLWGNPVCPSLHHTAFHISTISPTSNKTSVSVWQRLALAFYQKIHFLNRFFFPSPRRKFFKCRSYFSKLLLLVSIAPTMALTAPYPQKWRRSDCSSCSFLLLPQSAQMRSCPREKAESKAWHTQTPALSQAVEWRRSAVLKQHWRQTYHGMLSLTHQAQVIESILIWNHWSPSGDKIKKPQVS